MIHAAAAPAASRFLRLFFFFKQKPAYDITRWLDFRRVLFRSPSQPAGRSTGGLARGAKPRRRCGRDPEQCSDEIPEIGRASCRERVEISVGAVSLKKKKRTTKGWPSYRPNSHQP